MYGMDIRSVLLNGLCVLSTQPMTAYLILYSHVVAYFHLVYYAEKMRFLKSLREKDSDILKNQALEDLHDRNETLYHRILVDHIEEMAPLIYTPTVGQACKEFGMRYTRTRGMYFTEVSRVNILV